MFNLLYLKNILPKLSFWKSNDPRARAFLLAFGVVAIVVMTSIPMPAHAGPIDALIEILANLILWIASLLGKLLLVVIGILIGIAQYNHFIDVQAVQTGWVIVRDVSNMFFILILLVISFGTILRIEQYRYQRLLGKLILMAILINLSKFIAGFFIDLMQVIMLTFVNAFKDAAAGNFTEMFQLKNILKFRDVKTPPPSGELLGAVLLAVAFLVIALMVTLIMVVVLIIRIIMLWILVILSPLAYMLAAYPGTQKYASMWWSSFWKHAVIGPVLAFFLWLALTVTTTTTSTLVQQVNESTQDVPSQVLTSTTPTDTELAGSVSQASTGEGILSFIFGIGMLMGALMVTQQFGGVAGNLAGRASSAIQKGGMAALVPLRLAQKGIKEGGKGLFGYAREEVGAKLGIQTSVDTWKEGWKHHRDRTRRERLNKMRGKASKRSGALGFLGTPDEFFDEYWGAQGIKRVARQGIGGGKSKKMDQRVEAGRERITTMQEKQKEYEDQAAIPTEQEYEATQEKLGSELSRLQGQGEPVEYDVAEIEPRVTAKMASLDADIKKIRDEQLKEVKERLASLPEDANVEMKTRLQEEKKKLETEIGTKQSEKFRLVDSLREAKEWNKPMKIDASTSFAADEARRVQERMNRLQQMKDKGQLTPSAAARQQVQMKAAEMGKSIKKLQDEQVTIEREAQHIRPAVNYALRRDQAQAIAKEKSEMLTDSWQELYSYFRDAKERGDLIRMGAAALKATEYANENEFFNMTGDGSDAQGLKSFIMNEFVGKKGMKDEKSRAKFEKEHGVKIEDEGIGMSEEQALNLANLISYQGEKVGHWMVARAVGHKDGKQYWQKEEDRLVEMTAEVRKQDFENFMRRSNRLAFGTETPEGETRAERARNFEATGERKYKNSPFAKAFIQENWNKFESLISRGRFGPNLSINLTSGENYNDLMKITEHIPEDQRKEFTKIVKKIQEFGSTAGEEPFDHLKRYIDEAYGKKSRIVNPPL
ncbi:MAG: hypothetical protein V1685_03785 [Parcubacteria group bacterium]